MKILMITGWGLGTAVLTPFVEQLRQQYQVEVWDIFDPNVESILAEKVRQASSFDVLMGWSLGGQLALLLANEIQQQLKIAKPVICCMSNPCFVANEAWPQAMPVEQYTQFKSSILADPKRGMQRFCTLVTLAGAAARERAKLLHQQLNSIDLNYQVKHLYLLQQLNLVDILKNHSVKMLFIFSENDMLVPYKVSQESVFLTTQNLNLVKIQGTHDAILFDTKLLVEPILKFLADLA